MCAAGNNVALHTPQLTDEEERLKLQAAWKDARSTILTQPIVKVAFWAVSPVAVAGASLWPRRFGTAGAQTELIHLSDEGGPEAPPPPAGTAASPKGS